MTNEYELNLNDAVKILLDANKYYKNGKLPMAVYCAYVAKCVFDDYQNELGTFLCEDIIDLGILDIRGLIIDRVNKSGVKLTPKTLEREIAASQEVVDLGILLTSRINKLDDLQTLYERLVHGDSSDSIYHFASSKN